MATAITTSVDYLDEQIDIASAGQEEFQLLATIAEEMKLHGLEATIEEFDAKSIKSLGYSIYLTSSFIMLFLVGTGTRHFYVLACRWFCALLRVSSILVRHSVIWILPSEARTLLLSTRPLVSLSQG